MNETHTKTAKPALKKPSQFQVLLLNDDYTTMEFVVEVLKRFFSKSEAQAQAIMLKVHMEGEGVCGTYSHDVAQTKVAQVLEFSRTNQQPLTCIIRQLGD